MISMNGDDKGGQLVMINIDESKNENPEKFRNFS